MMLDSEKKDLLYRIIKKLILYSLVAIFLSLVFVIYSVTGTTYNYQFNGGSDEGFVRYSTAAGSTTANFSGNYYTCTTGGNYCIYRVPIEINFPLNITLMMKATSQYVRIGYNTLNSTSTAGAGIGIDYQYQAHTATGKLSAFRNDSYLGDIATGKYFSSWSKVAALYLENGTAYYYLNDSLIGIYNYGTFYPPYHNFAIYAYDSTHFVDNITIKSGNDTIGYMYFNSSLQYMNYTEESSINFTMNLTQVDNPNLEASNCSFYVNNQLNFTEKDLTTSPEGITYRDYNFSIPTINKTELFNITINCFGFDSLHPELGFYLGNFSNSYLVYVNSTITISGNATHSIEDIYTLLEEQNLLIQEIYDNINMLPIVALYAVFFTIVFLAIKYGMHLFALGCYLITIALDFLILALIWDKYWPYTETWSGLKLVYLGIFFLMTLLWLGFKAFGLLVITVKTTK